MFFSLCVHIFHLTVAAALRRGLEQFQYYNIKFSNQTLMRKVYSRKVARNRSQSLPLMSDSCTEKCFDFYFLIRYCDLPRRNTKNLQQQVLNLIFIFVSYIL